MRFSTLSTITSMETTKMKPADDKKTVQAGKKVKAIHKAIDQFEGDRYPVEFIRLAAYHKKDKGGIVRITDIIFV